MKHTALDEMPTEKLVDLFSQIGVAQDEADLGGNIAKYSRLFRRMTDVANELKSRKGDERSALMRLYAHPNMQVRLQAAKKTLAVAPVEARKQLEQIVASKWFPQAGDAGMSLWNLDNGVFKPE